MNHPFIDNIFSSLSTTPSPQLTAEQETALLEPYTYIASAPGKGFCNRFIQAFDHWLRVPPAQLNAITRSVELLHNAALLVDDIEDDSELRRGKPVAHRIYGVPQTINSANYIYFLVYREVCEIPRAGQVERPYALGPGLPHQKPPDSGLDLVQILNDEMLALHCGQGKEIFWRDHLQCPTEEEYIQMVRDKTAGLLRIAVRLMIQCATINTDINYVPLANLLGIWYQIRDDYMNLQSNAYTERKGFAEDLSEGKFSFPIIHGIRADPDSKYIMNVLRQRPKSPTPKHQAISYLKDVTHSFEYTFSALNSLEMQARAEVMRLGGNQKLEAILDSLGVRDR